jgi:hypothetical protein
MDGRFSELSRRIEAKYGHHGKIGELYEIDGKIYKVTDGNVRHISNKVSEIIEELSKKYKE